MAAQVAGETIEQSQPLRALVQFCGAIDAFLKQAGVFQCNRRLAGKGCRCLDVLMAEVFRLYLFQCNRADHF